MEFMTYKGYPLVRKGDDMYYGFMNGEHVIMLHVEKAKEENGVKVAEKGRFFKMKTDEGLSPIEAIVQQAERNTLYDALDVGYNWLHRTK